MRRLLSTLAALVLGVAPVVSVRAETFGSPQTPIDVSFHCPAPGAVPPEDASISGVTDDGKAISLTVTVALDGVSRRRAEIVFDKAAEAYAPLDIVLEPLFRRVHFRSPDVNEAGDPAAEILSLLYFVRERFGGEVPRGSDVVYVATDKDLYLREDGERNYGYGGYADCIGGVRDRHTAFAVGEAELAAERETIAGVVRPAMNASAKIAAHEIGQLMGGRHEEANCVEGIPSELVPEGDVASPCTLMWGFSGFSINFGTVEAAVVRGYARRFASP